MRKLDVIFGVIIAAVLVSALAFVMMRPVPTVSVALLLQDPFKYRQSRIKVRGEILRDPSIRFVGSSPKPVKSFRVFDREALGNPNGFTDWGRGLLVQIGSGSWTDLPQKKLVELEGTIEPSDIPGEVQLRIEKVKTL